MCILSLISGLTSRALAAARQQSPSSYNLLLQLLQVQMHLQPHGEMYQSLLSIACFTQIGDRETQTWAPICPHLGSSLFLWDPPFPWASSLSSTLYNIFLGLLALVTHSEFHPTPDKETTFHRLFISSQNYVWFSLLPDPLFHIILGGSFPLSNPG